VFVNGSNLWMAYITIGTTGNASSFGTLQSQGQRVDPAAASNGTNQRGLFAGGPDTGTNLIEYITINSPGNGTDFGDVWNGTSGMAATSNA